jgi:hypothetical protein
MLVIRRSSAGFHGAWVLRGVHVRTCLPCLLGKEHGKDNLCSAFSMQNTTKTICVLRFLTEGTTKRAVCPAPMVLRRTIILVHGNSKVSRSGDGSVAGSLQSVIEV